MNIEEDELTALRSAALATLAMKPQKARNETPEEDLTALRQAALMTRKQKQIQVIQRPVEQKTTFTTWLGGGHQVRGTMYRPKSGIPPPQNSNIRLIQPVGILPPPSFPQRPPLFFSPPNTSWGANNLINLTPGPAAPVPLMSLPRHGHMNFVRPLLPFLIAPRQPQRAPAHQNFMVPTHGGHPGSGNRFPWSNRPVRHAVTKVRAAKPKNTSQNTPEVKVPGKFSRYDPDSSSDDDDDERATAGSKQKDEESDAESEASHKSFSSVSAASENEENTAMDEDDQDDHNNVGEAKGDISIANEEDGILAAIEEFLDEGINAAQPKIELSPIVSSQKSKAKPTCAKLKKTQKSVLKTEKTQPGSNTNKKTKQDASKGRKLISFKDKAETRATRDTRTTIETKSSSLPSSRHEIGHVREWDENFNTKDRLQQDIEKNKVPKTKKDVLLQTKEKSEKLIGVTELQKSKNADRPIIPITVRNVPDVANEPSQALPAQHRVEPEGRQRQNSDLDSVGSSDLSFLSSSDSENEIIKAPKPSPKQPVRLVKKIETRGKKFDENRDSELLETVRKTNIKERIGLREKYEKNLLDDEGKAQKTSYIDLRTKLNPKKGEDTQVRSVDLREKIKHRKKVNPNTETMPASKQASIIREPSPITVKSVRIPSEKKSTIINFSSNSKSQNLLLKARNIVITRKRTPSPTRERDSIRIDARKPVKIEEKRKRSSSSRSTGVIVKRIPEKDTKRPPSQISKVKVRKIKDSDGTKDNVDYRKGISRKSALKGASINLKFLQQRSLSKTSESEAESGEDVEILDIHEYDDIDNRKVVPRKSALKDASINPKFLRQRSLSKTSESEAVEDADILDIHEYDDMLFDIDGDEENAVSSTQKHVTPKSRKRSANTREPETYQDNTSESVSDEEVAKEIKLSSKHAPLKKRNVKRSNSDLKKRPKYGEIGKHENPRVHKQTSGNRNETRHILIATEYTQDGRAKERESKRDLKCSSLTTEKYGKNSMKLEIDEPENPRMHKSTTKRNKSETRRVLIAPKYTQDGRTKEKETENYKLTTENYKLTTENYKSAGKKSMKKRLGSRIVVKKNKVSFGNESLHSKDFDSNSDDGWRPVKPRKVVKTKRKKSSSSNDRLEARIHRIKKQNGLILRRQQEIQFEKEKFG